MSTISSACEVHNLPLSAGKSAGDPKIRNEKDAAALAAKIAKKREAEATGDSIGGAAAGAGKR
jgi:hypothetical protein